MTPEQPEHPVFGPPERDLQFGRRYTRWAIWGCGVLALVGVLLFAGFVLVTVARPGLMKETEALSTCRDHLDEVAGALERYNSDKGHMPRTLEELYPTYLARDSNLRCPSDKGRTKGTSYVYRPWIGTGQGTAILVYCPYHPPLMKAGSNQGDVQQPIPVIEQDGTVAVTTMKLADLQKEDAAHASSPNTTLKAVPPAAGPSGAATKAPPPAAGASTTVPKAAPPAAVQAEPPAPAGRR